MFLALAVSSFLIWLVRGLDMLAGVLFRIPELPAAVPQSVPAAVFPKISIIFSARNESAGLRPALASLLAQDYPDYEVIAVNDRSDDDTMQVMQSFAADPRLKVIPVKDLPSGWLGKNHGLHQGYLRSEGDWLLFTDADVIFKPDTLTSALTFVKGRGWDHLTLVPEMILSRWIEKVFVVYFVLAFFMRFRPWAAAESRSGAFVGIGAFNLVSRRIYEACGTHRAIPMKVIDDVELGKLIKLGGFRQIICYGEKFISVPWVSGWKGVFNSLMKNAYAGLDYQWIMIPLMTVHYFWIDLIPFLAVLFGSGYVRLIGMMAIVMIAAVYGAVGKRSSYALWVFPFHAFAGLLLLVIFWRSAWMVWTRKGVVWRGTFYPLNQLKV